MSATTLERLPVGSATVFFPDVQKKLPAIRFDYPNGWKARALEEKAFVAGGGFQLDFWNIDAVLRANPARVYITEGEMDALALVEAGIPSDCVLSVPNGARERPVDQPRASRGYEYVERALKGGLAKIKQFVWVGDSDGPGRVLRDDMVHILGAARFYFVDWPGDVKDANGFLQAEGPAALYSYVCDRALPWPVKGVYLLSQMPEPPPLEPWHPGFPEWGNRVLLAPRTLSVVTGNPGHGKTVFFSQLWFNIVRDYGIPAAVATFETRPRPHLRRQLRTLYIGKLERDMTEEDTRVADRWIDMRYVFLQHHDNQPSFGWLLDCAEVAVVRHGCRILTVDPWNRLESSRDPAENETDYIGRCLRTLYTFATDYNVHVQIIAHPSKIDASKRNMPPTLADISGSKNWDNMPDQGFCVHRPKMSDGLERVTEANVYHRKARFEELGYPCKLAVRYNLKTGAFESIDAEVKSAVGSNLVPVDKPSGVAHAGRGGVLD